MDGFNPFAAGAVGVSNDDALKNFMNNDAIPGGNDTQATKPLGRQTSVRKLLVVVFIVDCSLTMQGERINAVNAALASMLVDLKELKAKEGVDVRMAVMSFANSARWEQSLTDVDEVVLEQLTVRPGHTWYGAAFNELNKVLDPEQFLKFDGVRAAPAIIFMTDGEPSDKESYRKNLDKLLGNSWFVGSGRSVVLMGDAINNPDARKAVAAFASDPGNIISADDSTNIVKSIELATMNVMPGTEKKDKPDNTPDNKPDNTQDNTPDNKPDNKPNNTTDGTPGGTTGGTPGGTTGSTMDDDIKKMMAQLKQNGGSLIDLPPTL